jgi:hypothetical protein
MLDFGLPIALKSKRDDPVERQLRGFFPGWQKSLEQPSRPSFSDNLGKMGDWGKTESGRLSPLPVTFAILGFFKVQPRQRDKKMSQSHQIGLSRFAFETALTFRSDGIGYRPAGSGLRSLSAPSTATEAP